MQQLVRINKLLFYSTFPQCMRALYRKGVQTVPTEESRTEVQRIEIHFQGYNREVEINPGPLNSNFEV